MSFLAAIVMILALYFAPAIVAFHRHRTNAGAILVLNLFLGWSGLGWIIALVWATTTPAGARR